ncbi:DUF6243 family protein [Streptomyces montanisoli]|uniref:Uncharacterized protein n=1 Tax=Streptomyces montanisoli TaxID=2798581 RepID=A0A940MDW1_9ACTN|nr:DUF6243 family protein [Streptomyces montanisoli]MBP0459088.1 hypothetical protein [Streptomyces montanisoli]
MSKSRNNLLGVGGQRRKLTRAQQQGTAPSATDRKAAADQKQELLRRMRERTAATTQDDAGAQGSGSGSGSGSAQEDTTAQD